MFHNCNLFPSDSVASPYRQSFELTIPCARPRNAEHRRAPKKPPDVICFNISLTISGSSLKKRIGFIESLLVRLKIWRLLLRPLRIYWVLLCKNCVAARESEARAGCNCDRWGHPYAGCLDPQKPNESRRPDFLTSQTAR